MPFICRTRRRIGLKEGPAPALAVLNLVDQTSAPPTTKLPVFVGAIELTGPAAATGADVPWPRAAEVRSRHRHSNCGILNSSAVRPSRQERSEPLLFILGHPQGRER